MKLSPLSLSLRQLQYAVAVADTLSFRAAAERCHVAQPALSAQLAQLDAALLALEAEIGDVAREVIARDPFMLATPPRHPLGVAAAPARPSDLREAPVLLLDDGHCFRDQVLAVCSRARVREGEFRATSL